MSGRIWKIGAVAALVALPVATAAGAWAGYLVGHSFEAAQHIPLHAAGTYYFEGFVGGVIGPFQPKGEITFGQAMSSGNYVIATYDALGHLVAIKRRFNGEQIFHFRYSYDADGAWQLARADRDF